jgi:CCR4-NOT transcription complex subunit 6
MNYNILCDKYATRHVYGYCPSWALKWDYRRKQILDELRSYAADIIALQVCISKFVDNISDELKLLFFFV